MKAKMQSEEGIQFHYLNENVPVQIQFKSNVCFLLGNFT